MDLFAIFRSRCRHEKPENPVELKFILGQLNLRGRPISTATLQLLQLGLLVVLCPFSPISLSPRSGSTPDKMEDQGIVERAELCEQTLASLQVAAKEGGSVGTSSLRDIQQLRDRFDQWTGNLGALQPASSPLSLEYRLRNSPDVRAVVGSLLGNLVKSLQSATDIAEGRRSNRTVEPLVISDQELAECEFSSSDSD